MKTLHTKYRPKKWEDVIGQDAVVEALSVMCKEKTSQTFLFTGPSGVGKTTIARIAARAMGVASQDIKLVNAAKHTGVDDMRSVEEIAYYRAFGTSGMRAVIIDECHKLSNSAWNSLLNITEEPPEHMVWFFCTTELTKIPKTMLTRCTQFTLSLLREGDLGEIFNEVCKAEKFNIPEDVANLIINKANGSPRQMLVYLAMCKNVKTKREAADLLRTALESDATLELCRFLMKGGSWPRAVDVVKRLEGQEPEGVRIIVCNYMASVLKNSTSDKQACHALNILDKFKTPYNTSEKMAPLLLSIGQCIFGE